MKVSNQEKWNEYREKNTDPYSKACVDYAEKWADAMEAKIADGKAVADIASETSHEADTEGITGFMYGCAVAMLSECWEHGEELRRWHNLDIQINKEGEKANEKGTVLNPALLSVGEKGGSDG